MRMKFSLILIIGLFLLNGCSIFDTPKELRVGIVSWSGYEPLALAYSLDYYLEDDIKIIRFPSVIDVMGAIRNGTIDVAALTIDEGMVYVQNNPDIRAFLVCDISNGGDAIVAKKGIVTAAQLKGKRIGAEESVLSSFILNRYMEASGLNLSDVTLVPINYDLHIQALSSDQADAVITYNPVKDQLIDQGGELLFDSSQIPGEIVDVLIAHESVLKSKKDLVLTLVDGWYKSLEYIKNNPQDAYKKMAAFENISPKQFKLAFKGLKIPSREESITMLSKKPGSLYDSTDKLAVMMKNMGLLNNTFTFEYFYTPEYLKVK